MRKKEMRKLLAKQGLLPKKKPGRIASLVKKLRSRKRQAKWKKEQEKMWPIYGARTRAWKRPERADKRILTLVKNGATGLQQDKRNLYLERVIGKKARTFKKNRAGEAIIPEEFEPIPLGMAMRRAFASIELPSKPKRTAVGKILEGLHKEGKIKIDFEKKTRVDFDNQAKKEIGELLSPKGDEFMECFESYLQDSTNWVKDYVHRKIQRVVKEPWDNSEK